MSIEKIHACCDDHNPSLLTVGDALKRIERDLTPIAGIRQVMIRDALGNILAEDVQSHINVPPFINSAMDGYAMRGENLPEQGKTSLTMIGTSFAGKLYMGTVQSGQCVQIFTGAVMPAGTDTVIMQEHVERKEDKFGITISIDDSHQIGQHVRGIGGDICEGQTVLKAGKKLLPADVGLLASLGILDIKIKRRLRVAFFSTGDELCSIGKTLQSGQIYDSNRYIIHAMLARLNVEITDMGVVRDDQQAIENALLSAANDNDAVITSGGVSVGAADYVTDILRRIGEVNFWRIAIKPGKPLAFGKIRNATFFGLPGNPVSVMGTFYQFVRPALQYMMGQNKVEPVRVKVPCISHLKKKPGRMDFQRGILETDETGCLVVRSTGKQGSSILSSMSRANCFIVLPMESGNIEVGDEVVVEPFEGLI